MNASRHQRGIIAWVLAVMLAGLALAMLTPFVMGQHKRSAEDSDRAALEAARTAVVAYAMTNGKLPTPVPDTKDPKRCPNGIMPADLGVNNWGRYGATNPFCMDTNVTLSGTSNPKALCAAARTALQHATSDPPHPLPRVFRDNAYTSSAPMAFVLYSTGNDHWSNLSQAPASAAARTYENDFRGIDDSPGDNHYDDQVLSYPLASLLAECGKAGGPGGVPICQLGATLPRIPLGSSTALIGSCSTPPKPALPTAVPPVLAASYPHPTTGVLISCPNTQPTWAVLENGGAATHATLPTATFDRVSSTINTSVSPTAVGTYVYTISDTCNEFGLSPSTPAVSATVIVDPLCTLVALPSPIDAGQSSTLSFSCSSVTAPTAVNWGTIPCATPGLLTCTINNITTTTTYSNVVPTYGSWPGPATSATVTVAPSCAIPVCTPSASPTPITSGIPSTLSANCSVTPAAALTYRWNNGCTNADEPCTVSPSTTTTYSVTATSGACSSVAAPTTVTVGADTPASLPAGYVVQGGLTWTPNTIGGNNLGGKISGTANWTVADDFCRNGTFNDQTGWRLPTITELTSLYNSGPINGEGWLLVRTWSSTVRSSDGKYASFQLSEGRIYYTGLTLAPFFPDVYNYYYVTCVRP